MKEKTLNNNRIYDGKIIQVDKDEVELSDGSTSIREVVHNSGGVSVLAFDTEDNLILVKQFRYPSKEVLYEIPGGKQDGDETFVETGMRELQEETGYVSDDVAYLGYFYPTVAYADEIIHLVVAKACVYKQKQLDPGEFTETVILSTEEALNKVDTNEIKDGKTIVAILKYLFQTKKQQ